MVGSERMRTGCRQLANRRYQSAEMNWLAILTRYPKKLKDSAIRHKACDLNDVRGVLIPTAFHRREFPRTGLILADLIDARIPIDSRGERPGQAETPFVAPVVRFWYWLRAPCR